jgi:hypothetical protein
MKQDVLEKLYIGKTKGTSEKHPTKPHECDGSGRGT